MKQEIHKFKKGESVYLDRVINILGLIPTDCYEQDDPIDWTITGDNDSGETVRFLKDVEIKASVKVRG